MDRRRFLLTSPAGALAAEAQQAAKIARVGLPMPVSSADAHTNVEAFRQGLRELGHIEGQNIAIEPRYSDGRDERLRNLAADLVNMKIAVIVTWGTPAARAARGATKTIPIVTAAVSDPVATGLIASLARPGGNLTGLRAEARR